MIYSISGTTLKKNPTAVIVDLKGIAYFVNIPLTTYEKIGDAGTTLTLYTYLHVREDALKLYGFYTEKERELFQLLISVSGIGPNLGLRVLSGSSVKEFESAVTQEDLVALTSIPGIGRKTAQRMIVELKEKIERLGLTSAQSDTVQRTTTPSVRNDAISALTSLGVKPKNAYEAVEKIVKEMGDDVPVEEIIRKSLKNVT